MYDPLVLEQILRLSLLCVLSLDPRVELLKWWLGS